MADLGVKKMILMTNNPLKINGLTGYGIEIVGREPIEMTCNEKNRVLYVHEVQEDGTHDSRASARRDREIERRIRKQINIKTMNLLEGKLLAEGQRIGIVAGRFNEFITSKLLGGALDAFKRHGGDEANIDLAWVPGAFEIPLVAKKMAETKKYDAVVCLGAVIRGATPHFDMVG